MTSNILIDLLPVSVQIDGKDYQINSDFRTGILFELLIQDKNVNDIDKISNMLELYYPIIPDNIEEAIDQALLFYRCGATQNQDRDNKNQKIPPRIYDFDFDANLIYSAFLSQYGMDLQDIEYLHWWKFIALFGGLSEQAEIVKVMGYRATDLSKIKNKNERNRIARLKAIYSLPDLLSREEKIARAGAIFGGGIK